MYVLGQGDRRPPKAGRIPDVWTQPLIYAAHRLYIRQNFARMPARDFARGDRQFAVFVRQLA